MFVAVCERDECMRMCPYARGCACKAQTLQRSLTDQYRVPSSHIKAAKNRMACYVSADNHAQDGGSIERAQRERAEEERGNTRRTRDVRRKESIVASVCGSKEK